MRPSRAFSRLGRSNRADLRANVLLEAHQPEIEGSGGPVLPRCARWEHVSPGLGLAVLQDYDADPHNQDQESAAGFVAAHDAYECGRRKRRLQPPPSE